MRLLRRGGETNRRGAELGGEAEVWLQRGGELFMRRDLEGAIACFDQTIKFKPDYHKAWYNRGVALLNLGCYSEAIASYDQAIKIKPDFHEAWYDRGVALDALGRKSEAIASYDQAIKLKPDYHEAWYNRGVALYALGRNSEAIASYDQAIKLKPDFHEAWSNRGAVLSALGRNSEAIACFDQAIKFKPDDHQAWYNRGVVLADLGRKSEAIASYDQAIKFKPDYHEAWSNRGNALDDLGRKSEAIASYDQAIKFKPDYHEAWYNRGVALADLGRKSEAIVSYDQAIKIKPDDHQAWYNRGNTLADLGSYSEAIASYDQAIKLKPDYHEAWYSRGNALYHLGRNSEAIACFDQAIKLKPDYHEAWFNRGVALYHLGHHSEAIASYDQAIKIKPDFHEAWFNRGLALADLGHHSEAIASYDQAIKFKPDLHQAWFNRGVALSELGHHSEAIASYDQAIKIKPDYHKAWFNRGNALAELGRHSEAIASYDQAIKFKPDLHQAWLNRGIAAGKSVSYSPLLTVSSDIVIQYPTLNQRGYEGRLASYEVGLKYCHQDTNPEGWGELHQAMGRAYYLQGVGERNHREYSRKAEAEYHQALITLTKEAFPELHLKVVQDLIRVLFDLDKHDEAKQWRRHGLEVFAELLNSPQKSSWQKRQLQAEFSGFSQMRVDVLIEDGDLVPALEAAERNKNFYLTWILDAKQENILSPSYSQIQQLINPTTAIVYWHLSPFALTTFLIHPGAEQPIIIATPKQKQLEVWIKNWDKQYQADGKRHQKTDSSTTASEDLNWRENLPELLEQLKDILNIPAIIESIQNTKSKIQNLKSKIQNPKSKIQNLILVPHRDLHRFPLHALFSDNFTITYLPSIQIGKTLQPKTDVKIWHSQPLLSIEYPSSEGLEILPYAEIESAAITQLLQNPNSQRISHTEASKTNVQNALKTGYSIFHFTGHASHNSQRPKESALYLSNQDYLTITDICNINFSGYELVSLAACETAITGKETIKEEYVGLVSAFLYKGASYVISSQWKVNELSSSLLMIYFYWQLKKGKSPAIAFTTATNWLRHLTNRKLEKIYKLIFPKLPKNEKTIRPFLRNQLHDLQKLESSQKNHKLFNHPYHWAAFTITGKTNLS
ncbi:tetratricopeptide repeat protein [Nostoc sp. UHCC 0702]|nr:tetratricopeptide repeat protein [Nostoc sp. UHCC 0702]